ncbi:hypothetical protein MRBBS_3044 [Marinobacter sp. BSs20148]|nr:hypothetical protein MRBBS_3044 [Marinobacter sp. BSs20148]
MLDRRVFTEAQGAALQGLKFDFLKYVWVDTTCIRSGNGKA